MTLDQALRQLKTLDENSILCAKQPWMPSSECVIITPNEDLSVPKHVKEAGFAYFLEVFLVRELLEDLGDKPIRTHDEKVRFLIYYAENDAYPDWANESIERERNPNSGKVTDREA